MSLPALLAQNIVSGILTAGVYSLAAFGFSLLWGVCKVPNATHGVMLVLASEISFFLYFYAGIDPLLSIPVSAGALSMIGLLLKRVVLSKRLSRAPPLQLFIVTYILSILTTNLIILFSGNEYRSITVGYAMRYYTLFGITFSFIRVISFVIAMAFLLGLWILVSRTFTGKAMRAVSQDEAGAMLCGIDKSRILTYSFLIGLGTAGVAGSLLGTMYTFYPDLGGVYIGRTISIVVVGGRGSITGTFLAALIIGVGESALSTFFPALIGAVFAYALMLLILLVRPQGLLGVRQ